VPDEVTLEDSLCSWVEITSAVPGEPPVPAGAAHTALQVGLPIPMVFASRAALTSHQLETHTDATIARSTLSGKAGRTS